MDIGTLRTDLLSGLTADLLQAMRDQSALAVEQTVADASLANNSSIITQSLVSGGGNMMDNLFVHATSEESRYVSAMKTSLAVDMQMQLSQSAALLERFGGINPSGTYFGSNGISDREVKEVLKSEGDKEIIEEAKKDFDKTAEEVEEKADEAVAAAGKDEPSALAGTNTGTDEPKSSTEVIAAEAEALAAKKQANGIDMATDTDITSQNVPLAAQAQIYSTQQNALSGVSPITHSVDTVV